jgi:hypothetical protein
MNTLRHKRRFLLILGFCFLLTLTLSGCGKTYWYSTTKDPAAFQQDHYQCSTEAAAYSANLGKAGKSSIIEARMLECMKLRGYAQASEGDIPKGAVKFE